MYTSTRQVTWPGTNGLLLCVTTRPMLVSKFETPKKLRKGQTKEQKGMRKGQWINLARTKTMGGEVWFKSNWKFENRYTPKG